MDIEEYFQIAREKEMEIGYDSTKSTLDHIDLVGTYLDFVIKNLRRRRIVHDKSKLEEPEKSVFDKMTWKLKGSTYGSDEYKGFLEEMKPALEHHYRENSHHPEHYENGIEGMSLLDLIEMICDWKAATQRHDDGNIRRSIEINAERFNISPALVQILRNTVDELGY